MLSLAALFATALLLMLVVLPELISSKMEQTTLSIDTMSLSSNSTGTVAGSITARGVITGLDQLPRLIESLVLELGDVKMSFAGATIGTLSHNTPIQAPTGGGDIDLLLESQLLVAGDELDAFSAFGNRLVMTENVTISMSTTTATAVMVRLTTVADHNAFFMTMLCVIGGLGYAAARGSCAILRTNNSPGLRRPRDGGGRLPGGTGRGPWLG
jgi:hypothetical protein